ncbi:MAG: DsbA family protein [Rhodospirillales bacterium]
MPRFLPSLAVFSALMFGLAGPAAALPGVEEAMKDRVLGRPDAPVTIIEYSSLTCPHCMAFHRDVLPELKKAYIDTGKAKLIYRDFPLGGLAMAAAMMARCAKPEQYFGLIEILFRGQAEWTRGEQPLIALSRIGRLAGLPDSEVQACFQYRDLWQAIKNSAKSAEQKYDINSTPSFVVNDQKISGSLPLEEFKKVIEAELAKKK